MSNVTCSLPYLPVRRVWTSRPAEALARMAGIRAGTTGAGKQSGTPGWPHVPLSLGPAGEVTRACDWEQCHCSEMPLCWVAVLTSGSEGKAPTCPTPAAGWCCFRGCSRAATAGSPTTMENMNLCFCFLTARRPTNRYTCEMHANLNSGETHLVAREELPAWSAGNMVPLN